MRKNQLIIIYVFCYIVTLLLNSGSLFAKQIKGVVFEDLNKNLKLDPGEMGVAGVMVSNQKQVVLTNSAGYYEIPSDDETTIFITKPAGFMVPLNKANLPQFFYIHQPKGSPRLKYGGIKPTGNVPESVNFPLVRVQESDTFKVVVFSDPQPRDHKELDYIRDDIVAELIGTRALCGITLGDIVFDDLSLYDRYNQIVSQIGIPFYNVPGNHDENYDAPNDRYSLETFKRHFGPNYYSFDYGKVHFIVLDVVDYLGRDETGNVHYQGRIGKTQLEWLNNDLSFVAKDRLVVLAMHIPLYTTYGDGSSINVVDRNDLFNLLQGREYVVALAGHMHTLEHNFIGKELGWQNHKPLHQIICAAVCGTWWTGPKDERGIPIADQRDGTPNGYHIFQFKGLNYSEYLKPANNSESFQIRISRPRGTITSEQARNTRIIVNVFNGSEKSIVKCQIDDQEFKIMTQTRMRDPFYELIYDQIKDQVPDWISPESSTHIWTAALPKDLTPGVHKIIIETTDQYGNHYQTAGIFELEGN